MLFRACQYEKTEKGLSLCCHEVPGLFLNFTFGTVFIFQSMLLFTKNKIPSLNGMLGAVYIGLFEMGITFLLWLKALRLSKTTAHAANLIYLVPFLSLIVIYFAVGEEILSSTIIGLIFIVGGIILQRLWRRTHAKISFISYLIHVMISSMVRATT